MDKQYQPADIEPRIYDLWEKEGHFTPSSDPKKKPFTVILPPPNANAPLHIGHAMYTVEDIMIRYHRMKGDSTLWLPGADHAGFETQFVFEKQLAKEGKSRFDFSRDDLYQAIWDFVQANRGTMENQLRRLGFSLDWTRQMFTLDPNVVKIVHDTFKKLYDDGLVYRNERLVNYCTRCGTGFSDLEVKHVEQNDPLYYLKYGPFTLATVRPETKFGDTAVAVHPTDKRYKKWIGKEIEFEGLLGTIQLKVIADEIVDPKFGTGVVKITPAHDPNDFETGKRHQLEIKQIIGFDGRLTKETGPYAGLKVKAARAKVVEDLQAKGLIEKIDEKYTHVVGTCYKCGTTLEPLPLPQWYIKIRPLADKAIDAIKKKKVTFVPKRFEKRANQWLTDFHDWNISRQIVWGIQIPAWYCLDCNEHDITFYFQPPLEVQETTISTATYADIKKYNLSFNDIKKNLRSVHFGQKATPIVALEKPQECPTCHSHKFAQEKDTFDTWFSSGQWPFATLQSTKAGDYDYFYPTSVMETGYDILPWWVCRMIMLGIYKTGKVPFSTVYLHGLVRDAKGQKMSKSKGNVINPLVMADKYGADALRMALIFGTAAGNDLSLSEDKIRGMRNFANKLWNITRFMFGYFDLLKKDDLVPMLNKKLKGLTNDDKTIIKELDQLIKKATKDMEAHRYSDVAQYIYDFAWHRLADWYIESIKARLKVLSDHPETPAPEAIAALSTLRHVLIHVLKLLHPFMPFVTEELWSKIPGITEKRLIVASWPKV